MKNKHISIDSLTFGNDLPFVLIAGPCVLETRDHAFYMVDYLKKLTEKLNIPFVYKTSFDKANRTSAESSRGVGLDKGLRIFEDIKKEFACPLITDVHAAEQCQPAAEVVDILQIPAFLCRQTDLLEAAAATKKAINVKKGQFLAPWDMANVAQKIAKAGNDNILLCERGASFGYNTLVSDMRSLPIMAQTGYPIIFDVTHSTQQPGGMGKTSGGQREFAPVLARAATSVGVAGLFMETHQDPDNAPSDGPNMIRLQQLEDLLRILKKIDLIAKENLITLDK